MLLGPSRINPLRRAGAGFWCLLEDPTCALSVEAETAGLLQSTAPTAAAIELRVRVLDAQHRSDDMARELKQTIAQTESFDVLDKLTEAARGHNLPEVEQLALRRQIGLTADPVHNLELSYQLVDLLQQHSPAAAAAEVGSIYSRHDKVLGVVRATVDFDWEHDRKPQAVSVLENRGGDRLP